MVVKFVASIQDFGNIGSEAQISGSARVLWAREWDPAPCTDLLEGSACVPQGLVALSPWSLTVLEPASQTEGLTPSSKSCLKAHILKNSLAQLLVLTSFA